MKRLSKTAVEDIQRVQFEEVDEGASRHGEEPAVVAAIVQCVVVGGIQAVTGHKHAGDPAELVGRSGGPGHHDAMWGCVI